MPWTQPRRRVLFAAGALILAMAAAACSDADAPATPAPSPASAVSATASSPPATSVSSPALPATPAASPAASTQPADVGGVPGHPAGRLLGAPVADAAIAAVLAGDTDAVRKLLVFSQVRCVASPQGLGAPPKCGDGVPEGTPTLVFITGACERQVILPPETAADIAAAARPGQRLYAAWPDQTPTLESATTILFAGPPATPGGKVTATTVTVNRYGILAFNFGCGEDPKARIATLRPPSFTLAPP